MSGIVGIFHRDGAPIDRPLLDELTGSMSFRGPDRQQIWSDGPIGFGHTLLRTTQESEKENQPCTLDGRVWIVADARVDARIELSGKLKSAGRQNIDQATDPELILHAYHVWGENCLEQLLGDFAFALWDGPRRLLFCARDHFGVKPFYYGEIGRSLVFSNTLNCLRLHPEISDKLNDLAIADFLLFDFNQNPATTSFTDIQQLAPGSYIVCTQERLQTKQYWTLPIGTEIRYKRAYDYVDRFRELFEAAVKDRLRTDRVTIFMSGGMDSTFVAAIANKLLNQKVESTGLRAYTFVCDELIPDQERHYSRLAADFFGIPIQYLVVDDFEPLAKDHQCPKPEPANSWFPEMEAEKYRQVAEYSRVVLTGDGADPGLHTNTGYISDFVQTHGWKAVIEGAIWCLRVSHRVPRLGLRTLLKGSLGKAEPSFRLPYPAWLNPQLEKRLDLGVRWEEINTSAVPTHARSEAVQALRAPSWPDLFERLDPGVTGFPIEQRHPFFDVRVVTFLTALPSLPWCQEKNLLKAAGHGLLPESVRLRPKARLAGDPLWERLRGFGPDWWAKTFKPMPELAKYVNLDVFPGGTITTPEDLWTALRLLSLNFWLQSGRKSRRIMKNSGSSEKQEHM